MPIIYAVLKYIAIVPITAAALFMYRHPAGDYQARDNLGLPGGQHQAHKIKKVAEEIPKTDDDHGTVDIIPMPLDNDTQLIVTMPYVGESGDTILLNYRLYGKGKCSDLTKNLMEAIRTRLAEAGFKYARRMPEPVIGARNFKLLLGGDVKYSVEEKEWIRTDGNLTVMIIHDKEWATLNIPIAEFEPLDAGDVNALADVIMSKMEPGMEI